MVAAQGVGSTHLEDPTLIPTRFGFRLAAVTLALTLSACLPPQTPEEDDQAYVVPSKISQELGPEGGEIVAPDDSPLAGVRLKVPPGALSSKVLLTLDATQDPTPLGSAAERVGLQVVIGPSDVVFASPVELTVPIDARSLGQHAQTHEDCKVWFRTTAQWARLERKLSVEGEVTVELPGPGVAAAGVVSRTGALSCVTQPVLCIGGLTPKITIPTCTSPTGYCIVKLPAPQFTPDNRLPNFTIVGRKLYYTHVPGIDQVSVARYDLDTGESVLLGTVNTTSSPEPTPIAVEADGSAWLALDRFGNVKFKQNTVPFRFDTGLENGRSKEGQGVVVTGGKALRFLEVGNVRKMAEGTTIKPFPSVDVPSSRTFSFQPRPTVPGEVIAVETIDFLGFNFDSTFAPEVFGANAYQDGAGSFKNEGIAALIHNPDQVLWKTATNGLQRIAIPPEQQLLAFDADDLVYTAGTLVPQLTIVREDNGVAVLPLTDAAAGTDEYRRMRPRALVGVPNRSEVFLQTAGAGTEQTREFYLVRKSN